MQGFPAEAGPNLRVLVDDNTHTDPTKDNILAGIRCVPIFSRAHHVRGRGGVGEVPLYSQYSL